MMTQKAQRSCPLLNFITTLSVVVEFNREVHYQQVGKKVGNQNE